MRISKTLQIIALVTQIWDRCEALSVTQRYWSSVYADAADVEHAVPLSVDTSIKSPLGTGSIKAAIPNCGEDIYIYERFDPDLGLVLDLSGTNRPASIFVQLSAARSVNVKVITLAGGVWKESIICPSTAVSANLMTQLMFNYSGISVSDLQNAVGIEVIVENYGKTTTMSAWIAGVASVAEAPPPSALTVTATPTPGTRGYPTTPFSVNIAWMPNNISNYSFRVDWGDGSTQPVNSLANGQGPVAFVTTHLYVSPGTYTIAVTVTDTVSGSAGVGHVSITINPVLSVGLTADKTSGNVPLPVTFTNDPEGGFAPYTWTLDYGDGTTPDTDTQTAAGSFTRSHTYIATGTFTATLTVTDVLGASIMSKSKILAGVQVGITPTTALEVIAVLSAIAGGLYVVTRR